MNCAPRCGLDISLSFRKFFIRSPMLSRSLSSVVSTAFFRFWVGFWVRRRREDRSEEKGLTDCTSVSKDKPAGRSAFEHPICARDSPGFCGTYGRVVLPEKGRETVKPQKKNDQGLSCAAEYRYLNGRPVPLSRQETGPSAHCKEKLCSGSNCRFIGGIFQ